MSKKLFVLAAASFFTIAAWSQTLFTYGSHSVDANDFLRAFEKNNTSTNNNKGEAIKEYLDLYIRSRLKIQEAYSRRLDTLAQLQTEVDNLRQQIVENYINDPESFNKLVNEAFQRSQKDIHVAHIFISSKKADGSIDSVAAKAKAAEVYSKLEKGEDFLKLAQQYSNDPAAKNNKGDIGFITVFNLPYEIESLAYTTPSGKFSKIHSSRAGYHIIKNLGERKALGKLKIQQILFAFPPGADEATKKAIAKRADSVYQRLLKGDNFGKLASQFSNDYISAASGGSVADIGVGEFQPAFESFAFSLSKDSAISKPFLTTHGYHIVKRIKRIPVVTDANDKSNMLILRGQVEINDRMAVSKKVLYEKVAQKAGFQKLPYDNSDLMVYTDSIIDFRSPGKPMRMTLDAGLFKIGGQTITAGQWTEYAKTFRYKTDGSGLKPYNVVMDDFIQHEAEQYYRDHLEDFNPDFKNQMTEFKEGNLFFEIMQQEIWNKAQADTTALEKYFTNNKTKYNWKQSADAVIFFCSDINTSRMAYDQLKKEPAKWRTIADALSEKVVADSSRYEWTQIPSGDKVAFQNGMITTPVLNTGDNSASFAYITKLYPQAEPRNFTEAKGLVINDYQNELEEKWITDLKKKYPVVIDQKVLESISK